MAWAIFFTRIMQTSDLITVALTGGDALSVRSGDIVIPHIDLQEPLKIECQHFIECVRDGKKPRSDGEAGLMVVRVLELAMRSLRSGGARVAYRLDPVQA